jgi:hypothetical protein
MGHLIFLLFVFYFDAFSSREPAATPPQMRGRLSLENAVGRLQKSQLMLAAAMRQNRFLFVMK